MFLSASNHCCCCCRCFRHPGYTALGERKHGKYIYPVDPLHVATIVLQLSISVHGSKKTSA